MPYLFLCRFGCRPVCMAGSLITCVAFSLSTLSVNVPMLMLTYGVLGGLGLGLIYLPAVVAVGYYFESKRALATGISVCGSGVGTFVFAPFATYLLEQYGWKGTNIIFAGLCLQVCISFSTILFIHFAKSAYSLRIRILKKTKVFHLFNDNKYINV